MPVELSTTLPQDRLCDPPGLHVPGPIFDSRVHVEQRRRPGGEGRHHVGGGHHGPAQQKLYIDVWIVVKTIV